MKFLSNETIRIFNGREVWIENSVTRVTVRHHLACRVMPNSYPEWRNFQFELNNHYRFFFLHTLFSTIAFRLEYVLFYKFYAKITTFFDQEMFGLAQLLYVDVKRFGGNDFKTSKSHTDVMHDSRLTSPHVRRHFLAPVVFTEIPVGYARKV